jgi:RNA polymerase sigma factor (sigma-70 family)
VDEQMLRLLQEKMKHIQRYLIRLGASHADAEDIVQDTVYKGLLYLDSIVPDKFSAWLYRVALNRYYDLLRKKKRIQWSIDEDVVGGSEIPEEILLPNEQREEIEHVMESLSPIFKQLIILKYELDFTYREISDLLGIREETVKTYLYRARKQFQRNYGGRYNERS